MSTIPTGKPFSRLSDFALDPTSVYESYAEAADYASKNPVAYVGQLLGVREGTICNVYVIQPDKTLKSAGGNIVVETVGNPVLGYQAFEIGTVVWQRPDKPVPDGWIPAGCVFNTAENTALYALYGTNVTPEFPVIDGNVPIVLGRYVDNLRVPADGTIQPTGLNRDKQEQLVVATNTILGQLRFEDDERQKILATIGSPALASDDLPTLHARLKRCLNLLHEKLSNKGIHESASSPLETLIGRIDEIETNFSTLRVESFSAVEPILLEKYANHTLSRLSLSWGYSDDSLLKYQSLAGPGSCVIDESDRSIALAPDVKDGEFEFVLTAVDREDHEIKRSLVVRYVLPVYHGVTQTFDIQSNEITLGTKEILHEGDYHAAFTNVSGYMFLAVPEEWTPLVSAVDPHGFDYLRGSLRILHRTITTPDGSEIPYRVYISRRYNKLDEYHFRFTQ